MDRARPTNNLADEAKAEIVAILTRHGVAMQAALSYIAGLETIGRWISPLPWKMVPVPATPEPMTSERAMLEALQRLEAELLARDGTFEHNGKRKSYRAHRSALLPRLSSLREDILRVISEYEDRDALQRQQIEEMNALNKGKKPKRLAIITRNIGYQWLMMDLEPKRNNDFRRFIELSTEGIRQAERLGPINDRLFDRLVTALRKSGGYPSIGGRPKKTPPE